MRFLVACGPTFFVTGCVFLLLQEEAEAIRNFKAVALDILSTVDKSGDPCLNAYRDLFQLKLDGLLQNPCQESFEAVMWGVREGNVRGTCCDTWSAVASVRNRCSISPCYGNQTAAAGRLAATAARSRHRGLGRCTAVSSRLCPHARSLSLSLCGILPPLRLPSGLP